MNNKKCITYTKLQPSKKLSSIKNGRDTNE